MSSYSLIMSEQQMWRPVIPTGVEHVIHEGFPRYLREAIFPWLWSKIAREHDFFKPNFFIEFQNALRKDLGFTSDDYLGWSNDALPYLRSLDDPAFTNLLDFALTKEFASSGVNPLEHVLSEGGSAWTVMRASNNSHRLAQRVPAGISGAMQEVLLMSDVASRKVQEAWIDAYGANPRASVSYSNSVVAVEVAALSVITVNKEKATLADLFSVLEAPNPGWRLIFRESPKVTGSMTLASMLRTLWSGHESRHGRPNYEDATLEEARAAVILSATLVQWFNSGVVMQVGT